MQNLTKLYCEIDDYVKAEESQGKKKLGLTKHRNRRGKLSASEIMTIIVMFQMSGFRTFKKYYEHLEKHYRKAFPDLISYNRFLELQPRVLVLLCGFLGTKKGKSTGIAFIDSTPIQVCKPKRAGRNKVFKDLAAKGKSTIGWFYGFKLHLIINDLGDLLSFTITPGNVNDLNPVSRLCKNLRGKLFGDKGYISQKLFKELLQRGIRFFTGVRKNMKNKLLENIDRILLRKRSLIETVNDQLKNIAHLEHSRYRSVASFAVNTVSALISYALQPKKPSLFHTSNSMQIA